MFRMLILSFLCFLSSARADMVLPRGVPMSRASLYPPGEKFTCLDGSDTIAFSYINDDYCDCEDGSDEPGTSACSKGSFFCPNIGHKGRHVSSSWVNDGICDCCDGSDEHAGATCANTCDELGAVVRARQAQIKEMRQRGYELRRQMVQKAQQILAEKQTRLTELEREKEVANNVKEQREAAKDAAEEQERTLLDAFQEAQRALEAEREEAEKQAAEEYFNRMDTDQNGMITAQELMQEPKLDKNGDGTVSEDEVNSITFNKQELNLEDFTTSVWHLLRPLLEAPPPEPVEEQAEQTQQQDAGSVDTAEHPPPAEHEEHLTDEQYELPDVDERDEDEEDDEEHDEDEDVGVGSYQEVGRHGPGQHHTEEHHGDPEYDPETQAAVDAAKQARLEFGEAEQKLRDIEREVTSVTSFTEMDLGPEKAFAALYHECFTMENREYEYKLCFFEKATQKPRSGGVETSLGRWGHWIDPETKNYSEQMYENGQQCWNGPKRSTHVTLTCGEETRLLEVTEPAMCEYVFTAQTPAACQLPADDTEQHYHDEL